MSDPERLEAWIIREALEISGPKTHLQDVQALIQFGLKVAVHVLAEDATMAAALIELLKIKLTKD